MSLPKSICVNELIHTEVRVLLISVIRLWKSFLLKMISRFNKTKARWTHRHLLISVSFVHVWLPVNACNSGDQRSHQNDLENVYKVAGWRMSPETTVSSLIFMSWHHWAKRAPEWVHPKTKLAQCRSQNNQLLYSLTTNILPPLCQKNHPRPVLAQLLLEV